MDLAFFFGSVQQDGDANNDGLINTADLLLLERHVLGFIVLPNSQKARVDLYPKNAPDGLLTIQDMLLMNQLLMGAQ